MSLTLRPEPIPVFHAGVLSATDLTRLTRWQDYLLGVSHGARALQYSPRELSTDSTTYELVWRWYMKHSGTSLVYAYRIIADSGSTGTWYAKLTYVDDTDTEQTALEHSGEDIAWTAETGTVDMSAFTGLTAGYNYEWRLYLKRAEAAIGYDVKCEWWYLAERSAVASWIAPPTFADTTSDPDELNVLRNDYTALGVACEPVNTAGGMGDDLTATTLEDWQPYAAGVYRYRPDGVHVALQGKYTYGDAWIWRVRQELWDGTTSTLYTSGHVTGTGAEQWVSTDLDLSGQGHAAGDLVRLLVDVQKVTGAEGESAVLHAYKVVMVRTSTGTPATGWDTTAGWAYGQTANPASKLNALSDNLVMLYLGGEALDSDTQAVSAMTGLNDYALCLAHTKRWLHYHCIDTNGVVMYGQEYADEEPLEGEPGWHILDLDEVTLPYGSYYLVTGCDAAWEGDNA